MPSTWLDALCKYRYPVTFTDFSCAHNYPGWFSFDLSIGDRSQTIEFESHFTKYAKNNIEPWLEVVYWKQYSRKGQLNEHTCNVGKRLKDTKPEFLWNTCITYMQGGTTKEAKKDRFNSFRKLFFKNRSIATVATFPAFLDPKSYPMVDTRIAKWVGKCMDLHNEADPAGPQLIRPPFLDSRREVLDMTDYKFMERWICWCGHTAMKLTSRKPLNGGWRARDVEMAVFTAWGERGKPHPVLHLNPLGPL